MFPPPQSWALDPRRTLCRFAAIGSVTFFKLLNIKSNKSFSFLYPIPECRSPTLSGLCPSYKLFCELIIVRRQTCRPGNKKKCFDLPRFFDLKKGFFFYMYSFAIGVYHYGAYYYYYFDIILRIPYNLQAKYVLIRNHDRSISDRIIGTHKPTVYLAPLSYPDNCKSRRQAIVIIISV